MSVMTTYNYLNLDEAQEACGVVVVIDVLRAFTTAAHAFNAGARKIYPVAEVAQAIQLRAEIPGACVMGEVNGIQPDEFDFGNSPDEIRQQNLMGKIMIQRTSAGTQGIVRAGHIDQLFAASFVVAKATAQHISALNPNEVSFIVTGASMGRDGDEDRACGEYIQAIISGEKPSPELFTQRVKQSTAGKAFLTNKTESRLSKDLLLCIEIDRFLFSLSVHRENALWVMEPKSL
jgi:2-phosphosulfolactate phosphatase